MRQAIIPVLIMLLSMQLDAQIPATAPDGREVYIVPAVIIDGDTLPDIVLPLTTIFEPVTFRTRREYRAYNRLVFNVRKVYPYARIAADKLNFYEDTLQGMSDNGERRDLMRKVEDEIRGEFEDDLKKLNFSQGTILIKLIDRETGETSFEILKDLRGRLIAGFWQSLGRLFGYNLKNRYDPEGADRQIEYIVRQIEAGRL